jgi:hypothetical protein
VSEQEIKELWEKFELLRASAHIRRWDLERILALVEGRKP